MDRLADRQRIVETLEVARLAQEHVNRRDDVRAARAAHDKARAAEQDAHREFNRLWREVYPDDRQIVKQVKAFAPDVISTGGTYPVLLRCAATGFPILKGDRVVARGSISNGDLVVVLADVIRPEVLETLDVTIVQAASDLDEDAEDDEPDDDLEPDDEDGEAAA